MTQQKALEEAKKTAAQIGAAVAVVFSTIDFAEDLSGNYGFCPLGATSMLYPNSTIECVVHPNGETVVMSLPSNN